MKLKYDEPLINFAFSFNTRHCTEGKSRNVKSLDEALVKREALGAREGKRMCVVDGRHRGLVGRVLKLVTQEGRSERAQVGRAEQVVSQIPLKPPLYTPFTPFLHPYYNPTTVLILVLYTSNKLFIHH